MIDNANAGNVAVAGIRENCLVGVSRTGTVSGDDTNKSGFILTKMRRDVDSSSLSPFCSVGEDCNFPQI